jgi:hypothetical protein
LGWRSSSIAWLAVGCWPVVQARTRRRSRPDCRSLRICREDYLRMRHRGCSKLRSRRHRRDRPRYPKYRPSFAAKKSTCPDFILRKSYVCLRSGRTPTARSHKDEWGRGWYRVALLRTALAPSSWASASARRTESPPSSWGLSFRPGARDAYIDLNFNQARPSCRQTRMQCRVARSTVRSNSVGKRTSSGGKRPAPAGEKSSTLHPTRTGPLRQIMPSTGSQNRCRGFNRHSSPTYMRRH